MPTKPKFSIASLSLGSNIHHDLPTKIRVASELGYDGIEIFMPDLDSFVDEVKQGRHSSLFASPPHLQHHINLECECATAISNLCRSQSISISVLHPLRDFENFATEDALVRAVDDAERWFKLAQRLSTDLVLVCSNFVEGPHPVNEDVAGKTMRDYLDTQVRAFRMLGQRAQNYGIRIGYEPLAWGTVVNRWEQVWAVVNEVDMPNVGIILDSFNSLGQQYADPSHPSGVRPIPMSTHVSNFTLLSQTIPASKLFFYQIGDASRPLTPFVSTPSQPARMTWSRSSRLFPFEKELGGYLPVPLFTQAVVETGYDGWWSLEVFNKSLQESDAGCPRRHGVRGIEGLERLWQEVRGNVTLAERRVGNASAPSIISTLSEIPRFVRGLLASWHVDWIFGLPLNFGTALTKEG
jgi:4-hydroxyphenylpyruvate dioxygenase